MALFHVASVIIFVKVLDKAILPFCRRNGIIFSTQWKISIGMVLGMVAMLAGNTNYKYVNNIYIFKEFSQSRRMKHFTDIFYYSIFYQLLLWRL